MRIIASVQRQNNEAADELVYEKKYFDYLPNDLDSEDVTDEDESVKSAAEQRAFVEEPGRRVNSRKFKRDLSRQERTRRQSIYFLHPIPLYHYSPFPHADFFSTFHHPEIPAASSIQSRFDYAPPNNNPWNPQNNPGIKLHRPYNGYLPPSSGRPGHK